jgi:hypothetical protein
VTVRKQISRLSFNSHREFRRWLQMPLNKVKEIVESFIVEDRVSEAHHCRSLLKLKRQNDDNGYTCNSWWERKFILADAYSD